MANNRTKTRNFPPRGWNEFQEWVKTLIENYRAYIDLISTPGKIPPPNPSIRLMIKLILAVWLWIQLGRIKVVGTEHLETKGRCIFVANHSSYFDALILQLIMKRRLNYMTSRDQFTLGDPTGLRAIVMSAAGAYPVDKSKGADVVRPSIELLILGGDLFVFPEGRIQENGDLGIFKTGAVRIAMAANARLLRQYTRDSVPQEEWDFVKVVPMSFCYGKRDPKTANGGYLEMCLKWRGNVTLTVGEAIEIPAGDAGDDIKYELTRQIKCWIGARAGDCSTISNPESDLCELPSS